MILLQYIVSRSISKWYKPQKVKKFAFNSQIKPDQLLTNNVQMLNLCLSCFTTTYCMHQGLLLTPSNPMHSDAGIWEKG